MIGERGAQRVAMGNHTLVRYTLSQAAMYGTAVFFLMLLIGTAAALRHADSSADVPVVAMSLLRRDPVFEPMRALELEMVARTASEVPVAAGHVIISEGEPGHRYYVVADGRLEISWGDETVRVVDRGGGFGEVALLADIPRTATVTATTDGALLAIDRVPFLSAITGHDSSRQAT